MRGPILYFDGHCHLCSRSVQFVLRHDRRGVFKFAPLQGKAGQQMLHRQSWKGFPPDSVILEDNGRVYTQSGAVLRILRYLPAPWPLLYGFVIVPGFVRNAIYRWVARNRYRWFGRSETCWMPRPEWRGRFLE